MHSRDMALYTGYGGTSWLSPLRLDGSKDDQAGEASPCYWRLRVSKLLTEVIRLVFTKIRLFYRFALKKRFNGSSDGQAWGWIGCPAAALGLYSLKLKPRELSGSSPLRSYGSHDSQMGGWTSCLVATDTQVRVGKQLLAAKGPNRKEAKWQPKTKSMLTLSHG
jgi:hypothetical protein